MTRERVTNTTIWMILLSRTATKVKAMAVLLPTSPLWTEMPGLWGSTMKIVKYRCPSLILGQMIRLMRRLRWLHLQQLRQTLLRPPQSHHCIRSSWERVLAWTRRQGPSRSVEGSARAAGLVLRAPAACSVGAAGIDPRALVAWSWMQRSSGLSWNRSWSSTSAPGESSSSSAPGESGSWPAPAGKTLAVRTTASTRRLHSSLQRTGMQLGTGSGMPCKQI
mmetsp:Transcript_12524/g.22070  ORF Transcript_12524/g.22070 Transcript_12524/m.22070 type:complete len:221 (+) Transcript_12524:425-1087(+)